MCPATHKLRAKPKNSICIKILPFSFAFLLILELYYMLNGLTLQNCKEIGSELTGKSAKIMRSYLIIFMCLWVYSNTSLGIQYLNQTQVWEFLE